MGRLIVAVAAPSHIARSNLNQVSDFVWEIPREFRPDMRVPARLYADEQLLESALADKSVEQLVNTATLPGIVRYALAMPDIHQGYGFPIGGVVATKLPDGVISPGGVGYDINCGVRVLAAHVGAEEIKPFLKDLASALYTNCPSGVGASSDPRLSDAELHNVLQEGSRWTRQKGYARSEDLAHTEEGGSIPGADAGLVSERAKQRGQDQLGTLGAGNHFIEVDRVTEIYDDHAASQLGLFDDQVAVQIHCGSRGLGHQVCQDYVNRFQKVVRDYGIMLLSCAVPLAHSRRSSCRRWRSCF